MSNRPGNLVLRGALAAALLLCSGACTAPARVEPAHAEAGAARYWPAAPEQPRIQYLRSVSRAADWGITKSAFRRFLDALTNRVDERLVRPTGIAVLADTLYVADPGARALWIFDGEGNRLVKVTEAGERELASPVAVAVRPDGAVFLADSKLAQVMLLSRDGAPLPFEASVRFTRPAGLAYDPEVQRLYVCDSATDRVFVLDGGGMLVASWGASGPEAGQFNHPTHLALDRSGNLLVTDSLNFRVQAFDRQGHPLWRVGRHGDTAGEMASAKGVAPDRDGRVFVVDALFDAVQIFDDRGTYLLTFGERGETPGQFWLPNGLFIDARDRIYVADSYNRRVQVFANLAVAGQGGSN
jgi:DNA-binding beta-propeller fold protein YncE